MVSAAALRALQGTIVVIYFAAGWSKGIGGDWLKYSDVLYTQVQGSHRTEIAAWALRTWPLWFWTLNQHLALFFELAAPLLLGMRKLRPIGFVLGVGMHLIIALTMFQLIYFSLLMWAYYALFVSAEQWRVLARVPKRLGREGLVALGDSARRFWEGWMGPGGNPGLPAWSRMEGTWVGKPALSWSALLVLWLLPFYWMGFSHARTSKTSRTVPKPQPVAANERIRVAQALQARWQAQRGAGVDGKLDDRDRSQSTLEEAAGGGGSVGRDAREPFTDKDVRAPARPALTPRLGRPPVPPPMRNPGGEPLPKELEQDR
jgi:hypothetical protein